MFIYNGLTHRRGTKWDLKSLSVCLLSKGDDRLFKSIVPLWERGNEGDFPRYAKQGSSPQRGVHPEVLPEGFILKVHPEGRQPL